MKSKRIVSSATEVTSLFSHLELPNKLEYYDDFADATHVIDNPTESDRWILEYDGEKNGLRLTDFAEDIRMLMKCYCAYLLSTQPPATVDHFCFFLRRIDAHLIERIAALDPTELTPLWQNLQASGTLIYTEYSALKSILHYFCSARIGDWEDVWREKISLQPLPKQDKYAAVRLAEEGAVVRFIDTEISELAAASEQIPLERLLSAATSPECARSRWTARCFVQVGLLV